VNNVTDSGGSSGFFRKDERYTELAAFMQDDIKLSPRLIVNAGLRYERVVRPIVRGRRRLKPSASIPLRITATPRVELKYDDLERNGWNFKKMKLCFSLVTQLSQHCHFQ
jgi:hypothetical protein